MSDLSRRSEAKTDPKHILDFTLAAESFAASYSNGECKEWERAREATGNMSEAACKLALDIRENPDLKLVIRVRLGGVKMPATTRLENALAGFVNGFKDFPYPPPDGAGLRSKAEEHAMSDRLQAIQQMDPAAAEISRTRYRNPKIAFSVSAVFMTPQDAIVATMGLTESSKRLIH